MTKHLILLLLFTGPAIAAEVPAQGNGLLYGRVTTQGGDAYEGRLRWDDEEASWGDLFHASKREPDWIEDAPRDALRERNNIEILGLRIGTHWGRADYNRQFIARFGDLRRIDVRGNDRAVVTLKSGATFAIEGGSNDIGGTIVVWDREAGEMRLRWNRIESIEFRSAPPGAAGPQRLLGSVRTREGTFSGAVQWDQEECMPEDVLDGETEDGDAKIAFGDIRAIERVSSRAARVELRGGRAFDLRGTNDVNDENRGIYVDDPRWGRVLISWKAFARADFSAGALPGYDEFPAGKRLAGTVTGGKGRTYRGRIVFDLDESETWELLNGERDGIEYLIPFSKIASIVPRGWDRSAVRLRDGSEIELEGGTDVGSDNAGVLVYPDSGGRPDYVAWDDVERIEFEP
jgi:hypothetical protein